MNKEIIEKIEKMYECKVINHIGNIYNTCKIVRALCDDNISTDVYIGEVIVTENGYQYQCLDAHSYTTDLDDYKVRRLV